jgi:hypothetical protein
MKQIFSFILSIIYFFSLSFICYGSEEQSKGAVLFDEGHGQKFFINDIGPFGISHFAAVFSAHGFTTETNSAPLDHQILKDRKILVISGPFAPYSAEEISAIQKFLSEGGHLCLMLHIAPPVNGLLHQLGINLASGVVYENENVLQENPLNFKATNLSPHPLTDTIELINFYGAWGFRSPLKNPDVLARTSSHAWIDLNRNGRVEPGMELYLYGLIIAGRIGKGHFVVFSDDAIFQNKFLKNENFILAENLVQWFSQ